MLSRLPCWHTLVGVHMRIDMLLCPEQSHTSPTRTSFTSTPFALRTRPSADASIGARRTSQRPSAPAVADTDCPANVTVTRSPASAVPHTATGFPRCSTMPSPNGEANFTAADADKAHSATRDRTDSLFMESALDLLDD